MNGQEITTGIFMIVIVSMALSLAVIATFAWLSYKERRKTKVLERQLQHEISMRGKIFNLDNPRQYTDEELGFKQTKKE